MSRERNRRKIRDTESPSSQYKHMRERGAGEVVHKPAVQLENDASHLLPFKDGESSFTEGMLLSQSSSTAPSLISDSSTISLQSLFSLSSFNKRAFIIEEPDPPVVSSLPVLTPTTACNLAAAALQVLIIGSSFSKKPPQSIRIKGPPLLTTLMTLSPFLFSPGYKELVGHNSKYLPTLSNALCSSLVRNVQGPGLRRKLLLLSNSGISDVQDGGHTGIEGSVERMTSVVQGKVWRMIQNGLFDSRAAKKLRWIDPSTKVGEDQDILSDVWEDDDLLAEQKCEIADDQLGFDFVFDDDELLFDDLVRYGHDQEDGDGLLYYPEEQERREVEMETDEMLFGEEREYEDDCLLFEEDHFENDSMLL